MWIVDSVLAHCLFLNRLFYLSPKSLSLLYTKINVVSFFSDCHICSCFNSWDTNKVALSYRTYSAVALLEQRSRWVWSWIGRKLLGISSSGFFTCLSWIGLISCCFDILWCIQCFKSGNFFQFCQNFLIMYLSELNIR